jgi:hypothetical protein
MSDLIKREDAIKVVDSYIGTDPIVEKLKEVLSAEPKQEWIPCSKRLPRAEKKKYWICTNSGYQCQCRWTNVNHVWTDLTTDWHWHIMDIPQHTEVVAWMSLPKPWKEVDDENDRCRYMCDRQSL